MKKAALCRPHTLDQTVDTPDGPMTLREVAKRHRIKLSIVIHRHNTGASPEELVAPVTERLNYRGVKHNPRWGRFKAYITINGVQKYLGSYKEAAEAAKAYDRAALRQMRIDGRKRQLNFDDGGPDGHPPTRQSLLQQLYGSPTAQPKYIYRKYDGKLEVHWHGGWRGRDFHYLGRVSTIDEALQLQWTYVRDSDQLHPEEADA
jgi:hypothetical protein